MNGSLTCHVVATITLLNVRSASWTRHRDFRDFGKTCFLLLLLDAQLFFALFRDSLLILCTCFVRVKSHFAAGAVSVAAFSTAEDIALCAGVVHLA